MKLVVLSDLHLTPPGDTLDDVNPLGRLQVAIDRINAVHGDADLVVLAGDLTDRSRTAAYEALHAALGALRVPWCATLGNHDNRDVFARVFGADHLEACGFAQTARRYGDQHVIVLDSLKKGPSDSGWGCTEGALCDVRLSWLAERLADTRGQPVVVVLHHPALQYSNVGDAWLLEAPEAFLKLIDGHADVRAVIAGHIHMTTMTLRRGVPFVTLSGGHTTSRENFGRIPHRQRISGPAQMAVVLSQQDQTTIHFDNYIDDHSELE